MTRKITTIAATVAIAALGVAGVVYAQSGETKKAGAVAAMQNCPMMEAMAEGPTAALMRRGALGLTETQVNRLESIEQRARDETRATLTQEQRGKFEQAGAGAMAGMHRMMPMSDSMHRMMGDRRAGMMDMTDGQRMQGMMRDGADSMRMHGDSSSMRNRPQG